MFEMHTQGNEHRCIRATASVLNDESKARGSQLTEGRSDLRAVLLERLLLRKLTGSTTLGGECKDSHLLEERLGL